METDADIETMFDDISYGKGASVLRMLRAYLTREMTPSPRLRRAAAAGQGQPLSARIHLMPRSAEPHTGAGCFALSRDSQQSWVLRVHMMIALPAWNIPDKLQDSSQWTCAQP